MDLNYQKPAEGILLQKDFGNCRFYNIPCDCGNPEHNITLEIEADETGISVRHYVKVKTDWWTMPTSYRWLNDFIHRCKLTWNVWINGYLEYEATTIMSEQQAFNYACTITQAIREVESAKKSQN
jgi:hypothetical protein